MGRYLRTTTRTDAAEISGLWKWLALLRRGHRVARTDQLSERMLRDIGLGDVRRSEHGKIERLGRP